MSTLRIVLLILTTIVDCCNILLIYIIWKKSPAKMQNFKVFLLKMAISDLLFSITLGWLFQPILLFPLPAAIVGGPFKYLGQDGGKIAIVAVLLTGLLSLFSVNDCCIARYSIIYEKKEVLKSFQKFSAFGISVPFLILAAAVLCYMTFGYACSYEELVLYAKRHGKEKYLPEYSTEMVLIAYDLDNPIHIAFDVMIIFVLCGLELAVVALSIVVQYKVNHSRSSTARKTYKMQRGLTIMQMLQATVPFASISAPVAVYLTAFASGLSKIYESNVTLVVSTIFIGGYPLMNSLLCLYLMKPYRKYIQRTGYDIAAKFNWCCSRSAKQHAQDIVIVESQ